MKALLLGTFTIFTALAFHSSTVGGQIQTIAFFGTVQDTSGALIPGMKVTATNNTTGASVSAMSNEGGEYRIPNLPEGTYSVSAEMNEFEYQGVRGLKLGTQGPIQQSFTLVYRGRGGDLFIQSDSNSPQASTTHYRGHVKLSMNGVQLYADELDYNAQTRFADVRGNVSVYVPRDSKSTVP